MAAVVFAILQVLGRAAAAGTLDEIASTGLKLIALVLPLVEEPSVQAGLAEVAVLLQARVRPAEPDDPAMAHAAPDHKFGGR